MHQVMTTAAHDMRHWNTKSPSGLVFLAVGDPRRLPDGVTEGDEGLRGVHFVGIDRVSAKTLEVIAPDIVLSPMVSTSFDCLELAERLDRIGYSGRFRIVVDHLPRPDLIRREIVAAFPSLDCDVLMLNRPKFAVVD
ncbi:MAG: hypothetical protein ACRBCL_10935 [Maritimibacter sp.]